MIPDIHPVVRPPPEGLSATASTQQGAGLRVEPLHEENGPLEGSVHGDAALVAACRTIFAEADKRSGRQLGSMLGSESRASFHPLPSAFHDLLVLCCVLSFGFIVACVLRDRSSHGDTATSNVQLTWVGVSWHHAPRKYLRQVTRCSR